MSVPLPGNYDADDLTDFATYDIVNARFELSLSSEGWSVATKRIQIFPATTSPYSPLDRPRRRSGQGPWRHPHDASGRADRSTFAVFDAASNRYAVSWDVLTPVAAPYGVSPQECSFPQGVDIPLAGLSATPGPRDTLAGIQIGSPMTLRRTTPSTSTCGAAAMPHSLSPSGAMAPPWSFRTSRAISLPDILLMDPELPLVRILKSDAGFTTTNQVYIGGPSAQLL